MYLDPLFITPAQQAKEEPINGFRRYCKSKGLSGKHKKRLRRELNGRKKKITSAMNALAGGTDG